MFKRAVEESYRLKVDLCAAALLALMDSVACSRQLILLAEFIVSIIRTACTACTCSDFERTELSQSCVSHHWNEYMCNMDKTRQLDLLANCAMPILTTVCTFPCSPFSTVCIYGCAYKQIMSLFCCVLQMKASRYVLNEVNKNHPTLPFTIRCVCGGRGLFPPKQAIRVCLWLDA